MRNKITKSFLLLLSSLFLITSYSCSDDDEPYIPSTGSNQDQLVPPTNVRARVVNSGIEITWTPVDNDYVDGYKIYRGDDNQSPMQLSYIGNSGTITGSYAIDTRPAEGYNYYTVVSIHRVDGSSYRSSEQSQEAYVYYSSGDSSGNGNNNSGNGNNNSGNDNNNTGDNGNAGGNGNTGGSQQKPSAPTGVTVENEGNDMIPDVRIRWNAVSNATNYYVYKSSSANGSYSKIGETSYAQYGYVDSNPPTNGASAYYKVKAVNSAGESQYSDYAKYTSTKNDEAFSPAYRYGNCTVSGYNMTLRWTNSTGYGYGKATSVVLRVWNPFAEEVQDTELSASATSATFNFSTKIDDYGYVKAAIVVSNAKGSFSAGTKVYDTKNKKWLN